MLTGVVVLVLSEDMIDVGEVNQVRVTERDNEPNEKASMKGREECYVLQTLSKWRG